jgi:DNA polymerase-3 subunit beta
MRAECRREGLLSACQLVSAAISSSKVETKPILSNLKAVADDGRCTLLATDLEVGIRLDVQGLEINEPGEAILPAAELIAILREARDEYLTIEADPAGCLVKGPSLEYEMPGEDPGQFPDVPTMSEEKYHEISAGSLREMIRRTIFAVAEGEGRYSMRGVLWEMEGETIRLVATDGRRLALAEGIGTPQGGHTTQGHAPVVPPKAMTLLERNLQDDEEEPVKVCVGTNEILFRTGRAVIYSRLVEGRFPDYRPVIPEKCAVKVNLNAGAFLAAVRQAAIMTDKESKKIAFSFAKNKLTLKSGARTGRSKVELPLEYDAKPIDINFNATFVQDMLRVLPAETALTLEMIDGGKPAVFRAGDDYLYLVMPLSDPSLPEDEE